MKINVAHNSRTPGQTQNIIKILLEDCIDDYGLPKNAKVNTHLITDGVDIFIDWVKKEKNINMKHLHIKGEGVTLGGMTFGIIFDVEENASLTKFLLKESDRLTQE